MDEVKSSEYQEHSLQLLNAHLAAQTGQAQKALALLNRLDPDKLALTHKASYHAIAGEAYYWAGNNEASRSNLQDALRLYAQADTASPLQIAQLRNMLGLTYYNQNQHRLAIEQHRLCRQAVLEGYVTEPRFKMKLFTNLGHEHLCLGEKETAIEYYQEALRWAVEGEDDLNRAHLYWGIGQTCFNMHDYTRARLNFYRALKLYEKLEAREFLPAIRNLLGWVLIERKEYQEAEKELLAALAEAGEAQNSEQLNRINVNLAYLYLEQARPDTAEPYAERGVSLASQGDNRQDLGLALAELAEVKLARNGRMEEGKKFFEEAVECLEKTESWEYLSQVYRRFAGALKKAGYYEEAFGVLEKAFKRPRAGH